MKMYASLIANIFTHVTLCTPKTSSFIAELQDMLKIWKTWDNLTSLINHGKMKAALRELYERSQVVSKGHQCNVTLNHPLEVPDEDVEYVSALLATILTNDEDVQKFYSCTNDDAQSLIDLVQALLDAHNVDIHAIFKRVLLHALIRLSRKSGHYPGGMALRELQYSGAPITGGGFGDIYKGSVLERAVAVKVLRTFGTEQELLKSLSCEVVVWRNTKHPNLLPFYGVFRQENLSAICLVSPWMDNGTVTNYVRNHDNVDYFSLIMDIAKGLQYLHGMLPTIVHGDIKGANIFVSPLGRACLADFGLAAVNDILLKLPSTTRHLGLSVRYSAPEILRASQAMDGKPTRATTMSDIYSFACVCYEIYSKLEPFGNSDSNQTSIAVLQGRRPSRPNSQQLDDALWQYIEKCWHQESKARPTAEAVVSYLSSRRPANGALEPHPDKEWDDDFRVQITYPLAQHPFHFLAN
ncbi:hypothetical protein SERLA73DRAFT_101655 [Serpula lacrymans var. lacrymans S7.3]|uniref:Protein kinase domain-containing protein n=2 Tax=Serpula lacrymans var. lacrymans TaxID=341189 RepID=F8PJS7_SERL3|nr:hypothetical protein SERLA73DRAFT_101655 [Serpula lacrymans var. lacrymans S7.3]